MRIPKTLILGGCFLLAIVGARAQTTEGPAILRAKPLSQAAQHNDLKKLQMRRYNEALQETQLSYKLLSQNVPGNFSAIDAGRRLLHAGVELHGRGKGSISFLGDLLEYADALTHVLENRPGSNKQLHQLQLLQARQFRLDVEIQKRKLETAVK